MFILVEKVEHLIWDKLACGVHPCYDINKQIKMSLIFVLPLFNMSNN